MRERAFAEAREQLPELRRNFFGAPADEFVPCPLNNGLVFAAEY